MEDSQLSITLYPQKLAMISIDRDKISDYCHPLLKYFIDKSNPFYSLTISKNEISLISEEEYANNFTDCKSKKGWFALHVSVGASNTEGDLVQLTSSVLKEANIPIFYISSFNDDFILVEETNIQMALTSLSNHFAIEIEVDGKNRKAKDHIKNLNGKISPNSTPNLPCKQSDSISYELGALKKDLILMSIKDEEKTLYLQKIIQLIFFTCSESKSRFVNLTQNENEISLLLDRESYTDVFNGSQNQRSQIKYKAIKRYGKKGFNEIGVINYLSKQLVKNDLRVLYLSTYLDAFMLVQESDFETAFSLLKQQDNIEIQYEEEL